jgi:methionyl-tRNA formyltransferase
MADEGPRKIVALCAVEAGVDTVVELARRGVRITGIIGLHPDAADPVKVSGWIDIAPIAESLGVASHRVRNYSLKDPADRAAIEALQPDLIIITGWQRLVPDWLLNLPRFGVIGGHGSPDGIGGGRGRSPQTWALLDGCDSFELSLFKVTPGIDEGPVLASRRFAYLSADDIAVSYMRCSLATADMLEEILSNPARLDAGIPQGEDGLYYPQREADDGWADWHLPASDVARHSRALSRPYPGLRCRAPNGETVILWQCQRFDSRIVDHPGAIGPCFVGGEFLVQCSDGRLLIRDWEAANGWRPRSGTVLEGRRWAEQIGAIVSRHVQKFPQLPVSPRITRHLEPTQLN